MLTTINTNWFKLIDNQLVDIFYPTWCEIFMKFDILYVDQVKLCVNVLLKYNNHQRQYHNISHIVAGLLQLEQLKSTITPSEYITLQLTFIFHDIDQAYDSNHTGNEYRSARLAHELLHNYVPEQQLDQICELILHTKYHTPSTILLNNLIHDIDYGIFGVTDTSLLDAYDDGIRFEWKHIPSEIFNTNRLKFLTELYAEPVFFSDQFNYHNDQAKLNIEYLMSKYVD